MWSAVGAPATFLAGAAFAAPAAFGLLVYRKRPQEIGMGQLNMGERFISEAIIPVVSTCDTSRMAAGEPGLPREFLWRGKTIEIAAVLRTWRESGK